MPSPRDTPPTTIDQVDSAVLSDERHPDPDATPRQNRNLRVGKRRINSDDESSFGSPTKSDTSGSVASTRSGRSRASGKRRMTELELANPEVSFSNPPTKLLPCGLKLLRQLQAAADIFDDRLEEKLRSWCDIRFASRELDSINFQRISPLGWEKSRSWSPEAFWVEIEELCDDVDKCIKEKRPEECWSDQIVVKIVDLATKGTLQHGRKHTEFINIKTVKVSPPELLPKLPDGRPVDNAKVDYGFGLEDNKDSKFHQTLRRLAEVSRPPSLAPSTERMLEKMPMFGYLEMKRENSGQDPLPQACTWVAASFTRLKLLTSDLQRVSKLSDKNTTRLSQFPIPLWTVQGANWQFYIAQEDETVSSRDARQINVCGPFFRMSATSAIDIIRLINVLSRLLKWGNTDFRTAFNSLIDLEAV